MRIGEPDGGAKPADQDRRHDDLAQQAAERAPGARQARDRALPTGPGAHARPPGARSPAETLQRRPAEVGRRTLGGRAAWLCGNKTRAGRQSGKPSRHSRSLGCRWPSSTNLPSSASLRGPYCWPSRARYHCTCEAGAVMGCSGTNAARNLSVLSCYPGPPSSHGTAGANSPACQRLSHHLRPREGIRPPIPPGRTGTVP